MARQGKCRMAIRECKVQIRLPVSRFLLCVFYLAVCVPLCLLSGCRSTRPFERLESGNVDFEDIHVQYEFDQPARRLTRGFDSDPQSIVDNELEPVAWKEEWTRAQLEIECPHPSGNEDVARLTLTLTASGPNGRGVRREKRLLAIPRQQVELLILDLSRSGYFDETLTSAGGTLLNVELDRHRVDRSWNDDGRLLDFAHRTLTRGAVLKESVRTPRRYGPSEAARGLRSQPQGR